MRQNQARRTALIDAAIEVLARDGARGLTFRAIDTEAAVPNGTASNYFANRDDLFNQVGRQIHQRLGPTRPEIERFTQAPPSRELVTEMLQALFQRTIRERSVYLALQELRLEATRRPELREALTGTVGSNLERETQGHLEAGLPGDAVTVALLYLAMNGLIVEHLTLPDVLARFDPEELVDAMVTRLTPASTEG